MGQGHTPYLYWHLLLSQLPAIRHKTTVKKDVVAARMDSNWYTEWADVAMSKEGPDNLHCILYVYLFYRNHILAETGENWDQEIISAIMN